MAEHAADGTGDHSGCCPLYHQAVELIGKRWTGAIVSVLLERPLRFSEISQAIPQLSDRLLSERMKELEARGIVERRVLPGPPVRVEYGLTEMWWGARTMRIAPVSREMILNYVAEHSLGLPRSY